MVIISNGKTARSITVEDLEDFTSKFLQHKTKKKKISFLDACGPAIGSADDFRRRYS